MALVRASFGHLLSPGLRKAFLGMDYERDAIQIVEEAEKMALIHPDTSKIPIWRRRPERVEHPIEGWRHWKIVSATWEDFEVDERITRYRLSSVAVNCTWDGPVIRADMPPVDPKIWDKYEKGSKEYREALMHTFEIAGVYAWKTREQAIESAPGYGSLAFGRLDLYGRVAQFKLGYRAEVAMVKEIYLFENSIRYMDAEYTRGKKGRTRNIVPEIVKQFEQTYGCEVHLYND